MAGSGLILAKAAALLLTDEKGRKTVGWIVAAIFSPLILIAAFLCSAASGGADHNNLAVEASFYGTSYTETVPAEFRSHISEMQEAFRLLDAAIAAANSSASEGGGLDPIQVKAIFYALCFGEDAPSRRAANRFVDCFFGEEERTRNVITESEDGTVTVTEETYTATVPVSLETAYANLSVLLDREITQEDKDNAAHIYTMIAGSVLGSSYDGPISYGGSIEPGGSRNVEIDVSGFLNPDTKNAHDLVAYAIQAWENGWGYVWGTYGGVLTEEAFQSKLEQYPDALSGNEDFIRANWVGGRTTDCCGLIKGYGWLDAETQSFVYGSNGMPDITANQMYHNASVSGEISTIPETPGLAVWHDGHIGVYIGGGYVIEAMGTRYGVVRTALEGRGWTHWLEIPYINYD